MTAPAPSPAPDPLGAPDRPAGGALVRALRQGAFDARLLLRNGEQLLVSLVLPVLVLVGLVQVEALGVGVDLAVPGVLALAVVSTAFTGQAIAVGFDRRAGVLRLLGTTPLGRGGLLAGRVLAVLAVLFVQVGVLAAVGVALGWRPDPAGAVPALILLLLGTAAWVALALLLAGTLRAEAVLAVANLVWVLLLALGGLVVPADRLPDPLGAVVSVLPSGALGDGLRAALADGVLDAGAVAVLLAWGALAAALVRRTFRWGA